LGAVGGTDRAALPEGRARPAADRDRSGSPTRRPRIRFTTASRSGTSWAWPEPADAPDATKLFRFQRLLERQHLTRAIFEAINGHLAAQDLVMREGAIVDAMIIAAPPSTGNPAAAR
jgi:hypothetical protein